MQETHADKACLNNKNMNKLVYRYIIFTLQGINKPIYEYNIILNIKIINAALIFRRIRPIFSIYIFSVGNSMM